MLRKIAMYGFLSLAVLAQLSAQRAGGGFRINGKAVDALTGQPLLHAEISIGMAEELNTTLQKVLTGPDGKFTFTELQPGKYWLAAQRNGFRRQGYEQHEGYMSAVAVGQGLDSDNLVFRVSPDASISGTVTNEEGEPVPNAGVSLFCTDVSTGVRQIFNLDETSANDRGHYHFGHLWSGKYFVVVSAQPWYSSFAALPAVDASERSIFDVVYPTTYYPGVTESGSASPIELKEGERFVADLAVTEEPALHLRVADVNSDRGVSLKQRVFNTLIDLPSGREVRTEGSVEIAGIAPGTYVLDVQSYAPVATTAYRVINLNSDRDIEADGAMALPLIRGVIQMEGGLHLLPQAFVRLWNTHTGEMLDTRFSEKGEFSFEPEFLTPGNYAVLVMNGENSSISSLSATGAKVVGQTIQITGSTPIRLSIRLPRTLSRINGTARLNGHPLAGAMIVLIPENPQANLPLFRRDQSDSDGTFALRDVVPGRYKIVGIENGWDLQWASPAVLNFRLDHAVSVDVQPNTTYQTTVAVE